MGRLGQAPDNRIEQVAHKFIQETSLTIKSNLCNSLENLSSFGKPAIRLINPAAAGNAIKPSFSCGKGCNWLAKLKNKNKINKTAWPCGQQCIDKDDKSEKACVDYLAPHPSKLKYFKE